jgi:hypothetical protein
MFGKGQIYVVYGNPNCNHGGTIDVKVWDKGWNGQEADENGLPYSVEATQLNPDTGQIDFVDPASQWNIWSDKEIVLADGQSKATITVQVENPYMDIRQAVDGNVYVGGTAAEGAVIKWNGMVDSINPTSIRMVTDPMTGRTTLELTSTEPGTAEITVTGGRAYTCFGIDDITLKSCLAWCDGYLPFGADCMSLCMSGDIGKYDCPTCKEYIPKFWCHYSWNEELTPKTITIKFIEVADKQIYLEKGWNFISTPYELNTTDDTFGELIVTQCGAPNVLDGQGWNSISQGWVTLTGASLIKPLEGYWIKMASPCIVTLVYGKAPMPSIPTKDVYVGWNAVGLTWNSPMIVRNALISIDKSYSQLIGWISGKQEYDLPIANTGGNGPMETGGAQMYPKQGYWIWVTTTNKLAGLTAL